MNEYVSDGAVILKHVLNRKTKFKDFDPPTYIVWGLYWSESKCRLKCCRLLKKCFYIHAERISNE